MRNAGAGEIAALRARYAEIASRLPRMERGADGRLLQKSRAALESAMRAVLRRERAVGACVVLCAPGGVDEVFCFGHARLRPRVPVTERTCFRMASVSKLAMAFGALSMAEDGLLSLDADAGALLRYPLRNPAFPDAPVTLRMLLTHTAGLTDDGPYGARGMRPGCTLRSLLEDPACWGGEAPGARFRYSNLSAGVAGVLMERAAGMPLEDIMQTRVFGPLGVRATFDPRRVGPPEDLADGYAVRAFLPPRRKYDAAELAARPPEPFDPERDYLCAAGRMICDARAAAALGRLLASRGETGVLRAETLSLMRAPQDGMGGVLSAGRGLNVALLPGVFGDRRAVGHQGVAYGMCAELFADPESGCAVAVMTSGVLLRRFPPLTRAGFDLLALGFAALPD